MFALLGAGAATASGPYVNPFPTANYSVGRTDMGVDVCLSAGDPIAAVGNGVVVGIEKDWYANQPFIWYQLTSGPYAGRYVYVAEQITHLPKVGQQLSAGDPVATYATKGSCIEMGWAAADGATLAQSTTGYHEGEVTAAGVSFARFLISLGVQGRFELTAPKAEGTTKKKATPATKPGTTTVHKTTATRTTKTASPTKTTRTPSKPSAPKPPAPKRPAPKRPAPKPPAPPGPSGGSSSAPPTGGTGPS